MDQKFYNLDADTVSKIEELKDKLALPFNLTIKYLGNSKLKTLIKLQKCNDITEHLTNINLIVFINEDYYNTIEEKHSEVLITQELDRLEFDIAKGTFKIAQYKLQTSVGVIKKYGIDLVSEANQLNELYQQQQEDAAEDKKQQSQSNKKEFLK